MKHVLTVLTLTVLCLPLFAQSDPLAELDKWSLMNDKDAAFIGKLYSFSID